MAQTPCAPTPEVSMSPLLLLVLAVSSPPPKVAVLPFSAVGLERAKGEFFTEHYAGRLREVGLSVVTQAEISALLGLERQRELLGCGDAATSCMAELASALGADVVAQGGIAKLEGSYQVTLKLLNARDGRVLGQRTGRVMGDENLTDALSRAAHELGREALAALRPGEAAPPMPSFRRHPLRGFSWVPAAVGVASLGVGVALAFSARGAFTRLTDPTVRLSELEATGLARDGQTSQLVAGALLGVGAAALGLAVTFFFLSSDGPRLQASLALTPSGFAVAGVWP